MTDYFAEILCAIQPIHKKAKMNAEQVEFWEATKELLEYIDEILELPKEKINVV